MSEAEIQNKIVATIKSILVTEDSSYSEEEIYEVVLNSLDYIRLLVQFEKEYSIRFEENELVLENSLTVGEIVEVVLSKLTGPQKLAPSGSE